MRIKTGHRESNEQHNKSDKENQKTQQGYRKGDQHSGGGGRLGGGGKRGRPITGWEKGDIVRDEDDHHSVYPVRVKPGKRRRLK